MDHLARTKLLLGDGVDKLRQKTVAVFGLGGVGGNAVEALARSGVGHLILVDHDTVSITNINRQLLATRSTVGMSKVAAAAARVRDIDPTIQITEMECFYGPDTDHLFDFTKIDYVVDAIDTVTGKLQLITAAKAANCPIICCMGTGNKLDATRFQITDIFKTTVCPLARQRRRSGKVPCLAAASRPRSQGPARPWRAMRKACAIHAEARRSQRRPRVQRSATVSCSESSGGRHL